VLRSVPWVCILLQNQRILKTFNLQCHLINLQMHHMDSQGSSQLEIRKSHHFKKYIYYVALNAMTSKWSFPPPPRLPNENLEATKLGIFILGHHNFNKFASKSRTFKGKLVDFGTSFQWHIKHFIRSWVGFLECQLNSSKLFCPFNLWLFEWP